MPRARRIVKWGGLVVCVVICAAWGLSIDRNVGHIARCYEASLTYGALYAIILPGDLAGGPTRWFNIQRSDELFWLPIYHSETTGVPSVYFVIVPLWIPFVLIVVPTVIAWRRDRRPKPGHCACGYSLEGNVSGRCPECGKEVATLAHRKVL